MITKNNLKEVLTKMDFKPNKNNTIYEKKYNQYDCSIVVDFNSEKIIYPEEKGLKIYQHTTTNFSDNENFVVLECVNRLFEKGYRPQHIELEKIWPLGHSQKGGKADIVVSNENEGSRHTLFIIECKTWGSEYENEKRNTLTDGGQLFSYWQQERSCEWLLLYSSEYENKEIVYKEESVCCKDDNSILEAKKKENEIKIFSEARTVEELFEVWDETYEKRMTGGIVFRDDSVAYRVEVKPLRKKDLRDFAANDKIVNKFEEILRHNNVSDKENAFNRLVALFICKIVDEIQKTENDEVEFQYKTGTDTYETLQDRLQRLHKEGMEKFMKEEIFYVSDDYADNLIQSYTGHKRTKMIEDLRNTIRILKFYTNNDFAFKDVHNEELFYQNGKIIVEVVQLFQNYRIIGSQDLQFLGDLFEQLLNKGFKQNEGQFFTPAPITRFIWKSLPLGKIINEENKNEYPKIIDYACGAGHFLTEGYDEINEYINSRGITKIDNWERNKIYGIEKDYRLARVSKISMFMHGANESNIVFGDGLENYADKGIEPNSFDILVANPPYSVNSFKEHLKIKNNSLDILSSISKDGKEIETLFVERINQLVKPNGYAAVILPTSLFEKNNEPFVLAREVILQNFSIKCIVSLGNKTFAKTGTPTVILYLQKYNEPPKRKDLISDSVQAIIENRNLSGWEDNEIIVSYLKRIGVRKKEYFDFIQKKGDYTKYKESNYFNHYVRDYLQTQEHANKIKQKTYKALSEKEKKEIINKMFFEYSIRIEREKLFYYGLTYNQKTLFISAPKDNKKQQEFLGYSWSDTKGSEGIQIFNEGGMLYSLDNGRSLSSLINNIFIDKEETINNLKKYYCYTTTSNLLTFEDGTFYKSLNMNINQYKYNKQIAIELYSLIDDLETISIINVPSPEKQQETIKKITSINEEISNKTNQINSCISKIEKAYRETFNFDSYKKEPIGNLYDLQLGKTPETKTYEYYRNGNNTWLSIADMAKCNRYTKDSEGKITNKAISDTNMKIVPKNTVIMSFKLTIGKTAITSESLYTNEAIIAFIEKEGTFLPKDYLRIWLSLHNWSHGQLSAVKGETLNKGTIGKEKIDIPFKEDLEVFKEKIKVIDKEIQAINKEISNLKESKEKIINNFTSAL